MFQTRRPAWTTRNARQRRRPWLPGRAGRERPWNAWPSGRDRCGRLRRSARARRPTWTSRNRRNAWTEGRIRNARRTGSPWNGRIPRTSGNQGRVGHARTSRSAWVASAGCKSKLMAFRHKFMPRKFAQFLCKCANYAKFLQHNLPSRNVLCK